MMQHIYELAGAGNQTMSRALIRLRMTTFGILGLVLTLAVSLFGVASPHLALGWGAIIFAAGLMLAIFGLVLRGLSLHPHRSFGAANIVTAIRSAIVSVTAATIFFTADLSAVPTTVWALVGLVLFALILDGIDGYLARSQSQESELGARFDMEVDALLILVLSAAGLILGKAGWWVLGIGLMRYAFVFAQLFLPSLADPLPTSFRRKLICVVQVAALCFILLPFILPPVSTWIAFIALALLSYSFAVDTIYLLRKGSQER
ncbi:CDP-alcohol phosphatidyltransferase family protein [uncultured Cohaesibacter sp.]|uniref:CDP-alcohol phosphatidyltransferase family protein n=1 Tax=uncultured Cohaesibacter sp. TaxID=1002546 RepID=UPI0029C86A4C|nr:CDP-alcohol phosphatidyltransferase family protein [uncultured Cohaesibacter sp.]